MKDSRVQGVKDSSDRLKNYKELKVWQASYKTCLHKSMLDFSILPLVPSMNWKPKR